ncbi:MAG TPA: SUMF1/EgtB/PvdO family nonheme iron enzyme, partial [Phycisphaerales bacterium]|nr:SUMF1/EgtB/PvdO family nonheme iron enzyme [Phycisphaerales bacterium]
FTTTPQSAALPAGNISWRMAAMYCNWLHNGKAANREAFLSGAYDVSTFTYESSGAFNDQLTRSPGARYFIPSWDEWLKAAHYDPNRQNPDGTTGGWWLYSNSSDQPFIAGRPGVGTANFGWDEFDYPGQSPFAVPLGAYTGVTSPWGLYDVAGAAAEWTEEAVYRPGFDLPSFRTYEGSRWGIPSVGLPDHVGVWRGDEFPSLSTYDLGFRVAASIPSPAGWGVALGLALITTVRRRRSNDQIRAVRSPMT